MNASVGIRPSQAQQSAVGVGPESLTWRYAGDVRYVLLGLSQAFLLQAAHPVISLGVEEHSTYKTDPVGRFERSIKLLWPVLYNTREGALEYGVRVRERHRDIKGSDSQGRAYHALSPEPYLWVHMTALESMIRFAGYVGEAPGPAAQEQMFREWLQLGLLLGLREQDMPATLAEFETRFAEILEQRLEQTPTLDFLMSAGYFVRIPKPPGVRLPNSVWRLVSQPLGALTFVLTRGSMAPRFRERFDVPWTRTDAAVFQVTTVALRGLWKILPERVRWLPEAWRAISDARRHPDKYRHPERAPA